MKICAIVNRYPTSDKPYPQFVHARLKAYMREGHDVCVLVYPSRSKKPKYVFEGISVYSAGTSSEALHILGKLGPDVLALHLATTPIVRLALRSHVPFVIWVHGAEALSPLDFFRYHYRPRYSLPWFLFFVLKLPKYSTNWLVLRSYLRKVLSSGRAGFVFVSSWMRSFSESRWGIDFNDYPIIPNPVDPSIFSFTERSSEQAFRVVTVRPFANHKYAIDVAIDAAARLDSRFEYHLYGDGPLYKYFERYFSIRSVNSQAKMQLERRLFLQKDLSALFASMGIALYPTRLDAQGVSMCEASATGLPVITSRFPAVAEFIKDGVNGFLLNSPDEMAEEIIWLAEHPRKYLRMSRDGARYTLDLLDIGRISRAELDYLDSIRYVHR